MVKDEEEELMMKDLSKNCEVFIDFQYYVISNKYKHFCEEIIKSIFEKESCDVEEHNYLAKIKEGFEQIQGRISELADRLRNKQDNNSRAKFEFKSDLNKDYQEKEHLFKEAASKLKDKLTSATIKVPVSEFREAVTKAVYSDKPKN